MTLPKDLKSVKRRGRAWRIVARIGKCLLITWVVLCFLFIAGYIILPYVIIASLVPPADGRRPPPVRPVPALKTAQNWCRGDLTRKLENSTIPLHVGDSVEYLMMPYEIVVEESFDFDPYFVFYGYIQWNNPDPEDRDFDALVERCRHMAELYDLYHYNYAKHIFNPQVYTDTVEPNLATRKPIFLREQPNEQYASKGAPILNDGEKGGIAYNSGRWLGF